MVGDEDAAVGGDEPGEDEGKDAATGGNGGEAADVDDASVVGDKELVVLIVLELSCWWHVSVVMLLNLFLITISRNLVVVVVVHMFEPYEEWLLTDCWGNFCIVVVSSVPIFWKGSFPPPVAVPALFRGFTSEAKLSLSLLSLKESAVSAEKREKTLLELYTKLHAFLDYVVGST